MNKIISILFAAVTVSGFADTWTDPKTDITWTYTLDDGEVSVGGGIRSTPAISKENTGSVTIPSTMAGYPVTAIGDYAFYYRSGLTSIKIPSSVKSIGANAFHYCSGLTSIKIPGSITSIDDTAFINCSELRKVLVTGSKNLEHIQELLAAAGVDFAKVTIEVAPPRAPTVIVH